MSPVTPVVLFLGIVIAFGMSALVYAHLVPKTAGWTRFIVGSLLIALVLMLIVLFQLSAIPFLPILHFPHVHFSITW